MGCPDCGSNKVQYPYDGYIQCRECEITLPFEEFDVRFQKHEAKRNGRVVEEEEREIEEKNDVKKDHHNSNADL